MARIGIGDYCIVVPIVQGRVATAVFLEVIIVCVVKP
jgi:hypothetical protein